MKNRSHRSELSSRVEFAQQLLTERLNRNQVIERLMDEFKVQPRQACNYIAKAYENWKSYPADDRQARRFEQREALLRLYSEAREEKRFSICIQIEKLLAKIDGTEISSHDLKGLQSEPFKLIIKDYRA